MAARRGLGSIDKLGPNRWRARYTDPAGNRRSAGIYATKKEAEQALAATETKIVTGEWQAPTIARTTLGDYLPGWLDAQEHRLAPATMRLYRDHARRYLLASLPGGRGRTINLAAVPLVAINHDLIRDWHQAVWTTAAKNRGRTPNLERQARNLTQAQAARLARRRRTQTIRAWATETGLPVANTGRLSPALVAAWQAAGSPERPEQVDDEAGRTTAKACNKLLRTVLTDAARSGLIAHLPPPVRGASTTNPEENSHSPPNNSGAWPTLCRHAGAPHYWSAPTEPCGPAKFAAYNAKT